MLNRVSPIHDFLGNQKGTGNIGQHFFISRLPLLMPLWNAYDMKEKMTEEATMLHF
jgi:hypothetical protein